MNKTFIIAEAGVNHNGDVQIAKKLCDAAKKAGADAVKFQTWVTDKIITQTVDQAEYQTANTGHNESQYDMLKRLELSYDDFREIKRYCDEIGILFMSTADEKDSLDFLIELGIPYIKIGSGDVGNVSYLRYIGSKKMPVILSTGMSSLADVELSLNALREGGTENIILLHCTTSYPCSFENVNLKAMDTLKTAFDLPVGYSDHTIGIEVPIAAVALGAVVIEKHFTLDRTMAGPDHVASTEPDEFCQMVKKIRNVEYALGVEKKIVTDVEKSISKVILKKIVAKRYIPAGKVIEEADLCTKRNEEGLPASMWDHIIGTKACKEFKFNEGIKF